MRRPLWYLVALAALVQGCATVALKPAEELKPLPPPVSLRAEASVEINRPITVQSRAVVLAEKPGSFRIEVLGPFGSAMALLLSDGKTIYLLSGGRSKLYSEGAPDIPYSFKPGEAVAYLTGNGPIESECGCEVSKDAYGRTSKVVKSENGKQVLTVTLADYRAVAGATVPFDIKITNKEKTLHIKYNSVEVNPRLDAGFFSTKGLP